MQRLFRILLKMLRELTTILNFDIDDTMRKLKQNDQASKQLLAMLRALNEFDDNDQNGVENAFLFAKAS